ncbi:MAG: hypothetical protein OEZ68_07390 [Gammaproteobacteria bacterium]|nr:hypothetical protein [Gammaproteobacteria bacterium]MDH5800608.1 hypothetical protein [Gammaproteobacteria bacterium]
MKGISDLRITGIDEKRPPVIRKEPYIDIFFKLSHQGPVDWCKDLNALLSKQANAPRINQKEGLFIEAWVRTPSEIAALLNQLKAKVAECNRNYIERIALSQRDASAENALLAQQGGGEQELLNKIVAALDFSDVASAR